MENKNALKISETCFICWSKFSYYWTWKDYRHKTNFEKTYDLIKCSKCWLEKIHPIPPYQEQISFYPDDYYSYKLSSKKNIYFRLNDFLNSFISFFETEIWNINNYKDGKLKNFLEIGCWDWFLLKEMDKYGWNSDWFEIWESKKEWNIYYWKSIVNVDFGKKYDLILLKHVFEHVDDPIGYLDQIKNILKDDWTCIIIWPVINRISSKIFGIYAAERDIPRHLFNYNKKNLLSLIWSKFVIEKIWKLRQISFLHSLIMLINWKFGIDLQTSLAKFVLYPFAIIFELLFTVIGSTNQIWFIIKNK